MFSISNARPCEDSPDTNLVEKIEDRPPIRPTATKSKPKPQQKNSKKVSLIKCELCEFTAKHKKSLVLHIASHTGERPYKCDVCGKGFKSSGNLKQHKNTHANIKPYQCNFCSKGFASVGDRVRHERFIHTKVKPYKCTHCGYASVMKRHLDDHLFSKHLGDAVTRKYQCKQCEYITGNYRLLLKHNEMHSGAKAVNRRDAGFQCDFCGKLYKRLDSLKNHIVANHSEEMPKYNCLKCTNTFCWANDLTVHMIKCHNEHHAKLCADERKACAKCGKVFRTAGEWKCHMCVYLKDISYGKNDGGGGYRWQDNEDGKSNLKPEVVSISSYCNEDCLQNDSSTVKTECCSDDEPSVKNYDTTENSVKIEKDYLESSVKTENDCLELSVKIEKDSCESSFTTSESDDKTSVKNEIGHQSSLKNEIMNFNQTSIKIGVKCESDEDESFTSMSMKDGQRTTDDAKDDLQSFDNFKSESNISDEDFMIDFNGFNGGSSPEL